MTITEKAQIIIEETLPDGTRFRDAIYVTAEEREILTAEDIEDMAQARVDAWVEAVSSPPEEENGQ